MAVTGAVHRGFEAMETVQRWRCSLVEWIGVPATEVDRYIDTLVTFCTARGTSPDGVLEAARKDLAAVLTEAERHGASLIVQSFLIHNGINVFGAIVCMPRTADQLAEQGELWAR